jgi:nicotinate-nucleotide pyrophosphorylase (carboxylating)
MDLMTSEMILRGVEQALAEDIGTGDVTTLATVPESSSVRATMAAREPLVICGMALVKAVFEKLSSAVKIQTCAADRQVLSHGQPLLRIAGPAQPILTGERVALNFVQRLSGIATLTAQYVAAVRHTRARILDTRKTTPGWRSLEKYAVTCGGGQNHRQGLYDQILIKDNHLAALRSAAPNPVAAAVRQARAHYPQLKIEVEADTLEQVKQALEAKADIILLDNMTLDQLRAAVQWVGDRALTEASGGVNLSTVTAIAETGVNYISVGALTHSARAVDIALDFDV